MYNHTTQPGYINRDPFLNTFRGMSRNFSVPVNIYETSNAFEIELMVPGRNKQDFQLKADKGLLTIEYQPTPVENEKKKIVQQDFTAHAFKKVFSLTDGIQTDTIQATYQDGILRVVLPIKAEKAPVTKTIAVQ
ncbi:MAG: Hsp20 family protein [Sphingobacteriales bacterium]|uniref:Hsp20/alpha crystallin family protein n=1 Tax=Hydrotalea flava TaxID=714549 RepID=UPI00082F1FB7|nr:Hsp20/alpha crystallin family protein [Hydrotalea flava]RTL56555.1 MAG: Hsp20 family protein [Sphingobacteriales bacterium]